MKILDPNVTTPLKSNDGAGEVRLLDEIARETFDRNVHSPKHYTQGPIECIDALQSALTVEQFFGFCLGNAIKYCWRAGHHPSGIGQNLDKAIWYLRMARGEDPRK